MGTVSARNTDITIGRKRDIATTMILDRDIGTIDIPRNDGPGTMITDLKNDDGATSMTGMVIDRVPDETETTINRTGEGTIEMVAQTTTTALASARLTAIETAAPHLETMIVDETAPRIALQNVLPL
jgi:hypothetical protein